LETNESPSVVVISASVGRPAVRRCAESVQAQDYPRVRHLVVVDGPEFAAGATQALADISQRKPLDIVVLPQNTGHSKHYGYRIYGAMPLLVDDDIVCYLDEDNWFDPDHVSVMVKALRATGADWAYSLRRICADDGSVICEDDSDSLGYWPKSATILPEGWLDDPAEVLMHKTYPNLVDSSCYALPRPLACSVAPLWQELHADSVVPSFLVPRHSGVCTGRSTVNYTLGGGTGTPPEWFTDGNQILRGLYGPGPFPWRRSPRRLGPGSIPHPQSPAQ
jgi:Glycosyltransferases, probably involved in cell wall biogenesis